jgi:hypothetical protein
MNTLSPFLSLNEPCDEVLPWLKQCLAAANLHVVQTFDLHDARHALVDCSCPHHGTDQCDCQMVVLLVYTGESWPATLILHGNDGRTWLSLVDRPGQPANAQAAAAIRQALEAGITAG